MIQLIGTGIVIGIKTGSGTDTGNEPVSEKVLVRKLVEEAGMGEEDWIGSKTITGTEEMEAGTGTVTGVDHVLLLGMVIGGLQEVLVAPISMLH